MSDDDLYAILQCDKDATMEELKRKYQKLVKQYHPDKAQAENNEMFLKLDNAWKVLREPELRKKYDAGRYSNDFDGQSLIYANLCLNELHFEDNIAYYPCRCGNSFVIDKAQLNGERTVVECDECSNCIFIEANKVS